MVWHLFTQNALVLLQHSLIYHNYIYSIAMQRRVPLWALISLAVFQKRVTQSWCGEKYNVPTQPLFKELRILNIRDIHRLKSLKFVQSQLANKTLRSCNSAATATQWYTHETKSQTSEAKERTKWKICLPLCSLPHEIQASNNTITVNTKTYKTT